MQQFAVFYQVDLAGKLSPIMGSEGVLPIDGRFGAQRAACEALAQVFNLRHVKPWIVGVELRKGNYRSSSAWTGIHPVSADKTPEFNAAKAKGIVPF